MPIRQIKLGLRLSKILFVLLGFICGAPLRAGGEIGNGGTSSFPMHATINNLDKRYLFRGPFPAGVVHSKEMDIYRFSIFDISLRIATFDRGRIPCPAPSLYKRVCQVHYDQHHHFLAGYIVYSTGQTFYLKLTSQQLTEEKLRLFYASITSTFSFIRSQP